MKSKERTRRDFAHASVRSHKTPENPDRSRVVRVVDVSHSRAHRERRVHRSTSLRAPVTPSDRPRRARDARVSSVASRRVARGRGTNKLKIC
eukprot:2653-Pelagococcus_subviridis.AAC.1